MTEKQLIRLLSKIMPKKPSLPILETVHISGKRLAVTDLKFSLVVDASPWESATPLCTDFQVLKTLGRVQDSGFPAGDFPEPLLSGDGVDLGTSWIAPARRVAWATSDKVSTKVFENVFLSAETGAAVATEGHVLHEIKFDWGSRGLDLLIPGKFLEILALIPEVPESSSLVGAALVVRYPWGWVSAKTETDCRYPNYWKVFPPMENYRGSISLDVATVKTWCSQARKLSKTPEILLLPAEDSTAKVFVKHGSGGTAWEPVGTLPNFHTSVPIRLNASFLQGAVSASDDPEISMLVWEDTGYGDCVSNIHPLIYHPVEGETVLVMPLRMMQDELPPLTEESK